ncbi:MAG TPA: hypothetical protein VK935_04945 [Actinomycetospora sp.]|nr:hypothetical protein [Actinomycetospora sp.]
MADRRWRAVGRHLGAGLGLLPASLGELGRLLRGEPTQAVLVARRHALGEEATVFGGRVGVARVVVHAVLGVLLGVFFWWLAAMAVLATARGPFYGLVDGGPHDDAWGGPGLTAAWAVHAGVGVLVVVVLGLLWWGLVTLHARSTEHLLGVRRRVWAVPGAVLVALASGLLVVSWVQRI